MRYFRIFLLSFQDVFEQRGKAFVWLLITAIVPLILILFWRGAKSLGGWTFPEIIAYYLLFIVLAAVLMAQHERNIAERDIQEGQLTGYLLKPYSYFWLKFFEELPWRLLQGALGILLLLGIALFFPTAITITSSPLLLSLSLVSMVLAFFIIFLFKTIVGIIAFWMTETRGLFEMVDATLVIFAGYLMPLAFFPSWLLGIAHYLPFAYMIYFPVMSLQGKLTTPEVMQGLFMQAVWLVVFMLGYKYLWREGLKKYTAVGQ